MKQTDLESIYEVLANTLDAIVPEQREVYLAKLALALCDTLGARQPCLDAILECRTGFDSADQAGR